MTSLQPEHVPVEQWRTIGEAVGAGDLPVDVIESLCYECHEQGITRMLLTVIPYFKEVIVCSFRCEHCGYTNNDIQSAGEIQPLGSVYTVKITTRADLDRQLVKSPSCVITIPEYQLQIPAGRGQFTTVEGVIADTIRDLGHDQPVRKIQHPDVYEKIQTWLTRLRMIVDPEEEEEEVEGAGQVKAKKIDRPMPVFTIKLDDPAGNSFIETQGGLTDPKWSKREYQRDAAQNESLGLAPDDPDSISKTHGGKETSHYPEEVLSFPGTCALCGSEMETLMKTVNIPHFKDIILMSTNCHDCGYRDNEVKSGGATADKGRKITLKVDDADDLSRDILKSDTAGLEIPEIDLELNPGTLGGRFTTLEGLLQQVYEELDEKVFARGDAAVVGETDQMKKFLEQLKLVRTIRVSNVRDPDVDSYCGSCPCHEQVMEARMQFTVILDDPLSNSYIQNLYAPDDDPNMTVEIYERTHEQNEELGLNDMKTEDYGHVDVKD
ncbi:BZ3500_MvSof-1268-A1-R1_Chr2-2g04861 [Microbotryum saponariae]|uniref:BZ3500_MvSof-1268-A1-R1_Chr2-2g04861 protein n=1 Tax=Microbotryum saponariae TaxID=289078 RepID=A0A2X0M8U5_9BASI|nr:BZ3500_MvSof-1268-A1-R1_Chr2-2g04861 [Microbotryum saponariae]SDA00346.1 BZ3501_MvSof-1269-A2-R1_Chr2-2g04535 [Microbotryum saponariae]